MAFDSINGPQVNSTSTAPPPAIMAAIVPTAVARRQKASISAGSTNVEAVAEALNTISFCRKSTGLMLAATPIAPRMIITMCDMRRSSASPAVGLRKR